MRGYPKTLNTKADYEYVKSHYGEDTWKNEYQKLLTTQYKWVPTKQLESEAAGITDETHRVIKQEDPENEDKTIYTQLERQTNPLGKIFRIGYTVAEVEAILA